MAEDPAHRTKLYNRLYTQDTRFATPVDYLSSLSGQVVGDQDIVTALIGDVEVDKNSVRRFVALDTRSREIRQRHQVSDRKSAETQEREPEKVLMVVRTYRSSVGLEYFIAFEDELGYLYGFTRLLLPDEDQTVDFP